MKVGSGFGSPPSAFADELRRLCKMDDGAETSNVVALR
jgi:hypothetical protein